MEIANKDRMAERLTIKNLIEFYNITVEKTIKEQMERVSTIINKTNNFQQRIHTIAKGLKTIFFILSFCINPAAVVNCG